MGYRQTPYDPRADDALAKTPGSKPHKFSFYLVLLAVPFWITGMALDREKPKQVLDEIMLLIAGALHGLAYFIIEGIGYLLFKSKWSNPACCCCCWLCTVRCNACVFGGLWIYGLVSLAALELNGSKGLRDFLLFVNFVTLFGYLLTRQILMWYVKRELVEGKEQPKETNQLELGEGIAGKEQPKETNQQAPGEANRKVKPSDSLTGKLQVLKQSKDQGLLLEAEFQQSKSDLISGVVMGGSKTA